MKIFTIINRRGGRKRSAGLITIGLAMLAGSNLADEVSDWTTREVIQLVVILVGILATAVLFAWKRADTHRN